MDKSILEIGESLRKRRLSPVELTTACLARIEKLNRQTKRLHYSDGGFRIGAGARRLKPRFYAETGEGHCMAFPSR